jgi:low temperature requirement protein LtrA
MRARGADEPHRVATPLELFFDHCFVVAVAQAANSLHEALSADHIRQVLVSYPMVFFAVWWAWMNFTWFASAYDTDDIAYRLAVFVQIVGVLILAAGVPRLFADHDLTVVTLGYAVMRVSLAGQWLRAAHSDPPSRRTNRRYAFGVSVCMLGWLVVLVLSGGWQVAAFLVMVVAELSVPILAERHGITTWHPHHIAERYGLFTLIVLGESVLGATFAVQSALDAGQAIGDLLVIAGGGLLVVFSMWWVYFSVPTEEPVTETGLDSFRWGYGHYVVFASAAAVGAGLAAAVDQATGKAEALSHRGATAAVAVPVALYLASIAFVRGRMQPVVHRTALLVAVAVVLAIAAVDLGVLAIGVVLALLVTAIVLTPVADDEAAPGLRKSAD